MKNIFYCVALLLLVSSCKKDPMPYTNSSGWIYNGGDGQVNEHEDLELDFDIENNLNVDGQAEIIGNVTIGSDLNLNDDGKVIIDIPYEDDTVYVNGNVNLNDSLLMIDGFLWINGNLNINDGGVLNVTDSAKVQVDGDINNSGYLFGNQNINTLGTLHNNSGNLQELPLQKI